LTPSRKTVRVDFCANSAAEHGFPHAARAALPMLRSRPLLIDGRRYVAYDAHSLLELIADLGRPGHPV
jgi:hypothetical protein